MKQMNEKGISNKQASDKNTSFFKRNPKVQELLIIVCIAFISVLLACVNAMIYTWDFKVIMESYANILILSACIFLALLVVYEFYFNKMKTEETTLQKLIMVGITLVVTVVCCMLFMKKVSPYATTLSVLPIILTIMINSAIGFMAMSSSIIILILSFGIMQISVAGAIGVEFFEIIACLIIALLRVVLIMFLIRKNYSRFKLMWGALAINLVASLPVMALAYIVEQNVKYIVSAYLYSILGGISGVIIFTALIPLYEQIFNVWTNFKLAEICSLSRPLLRRMSKEAPGTFNHCIIVSNLAEACAIAIGENPYLAKACGIYHDAGKLEAPEFFTENQEGGYNPHNDLIPEHSAKMIMAHTKLGFELLKKERLPEEIAKVAREHHGTTQVKYFLNKARQLTEGTVEERLFTYEGPKPTSKIAVIVMIADVVEAITRSRNTADQSELKSIIDGVIKEKIDAGQFEDSEITFSDLKKISEAISKVIPAVYHKRIDYRK